MWTPPRGIDFCIIFQTNHLRATDFCRILKTKEIICKIFKTLELWFLWRFWETQACGWWILSPTLHLIVGANGY
jgi:hypothetical protein